MSGSLFRPARMVLTIVAATLAIALATCAMPIRQWRTGEAAALALPVATGGPHVEMSVRVWIDTDAACGHGRTTDPDDCRALLLMARADRIRIEGVSTVFGNAALDVTDATTRDLLARLNRERTRAEPVYRGAGHATIEGPEDGGTV